jgi:quinol monooxygenase YgiN
MVEPGRQTFNGSMGRIVIACYRPKAGKREALRRLILDHVATLRAQGLVTDRAPIIMEAKDGTVVEVFEWASPAAIEAAHANPAVQAMWNRYAEVCDYIPIAQVPEAAEMFSEFAPLEGVRETGGRPPRFAPPALRRTPPARRRNEFGDPTDTLYAGGTPRFDETGRKPPGPRKGRP